ncbi:MAG: VCBS repeat-containing protein [Verrucomicrobia bacterium]|nr:VCBS repeat-containing protein [Verrucomicrobiota bacterium]
MSANGAATLGYQWYFNNTPISGATGNSFTLNNVKASDAGSYFVVVSNAVGAVASTTVTLSVQAACNISLSAITAAFGASGGNGSVSINSTNGCSWNVVNPSTWLTLTSPGSGSSNGVVSYSVAANPSTAARAAPLTIGGLNYSIVQAGAGNGSTNGIYTFTTLAGLVGKTGSADGVGSAARFNHPRYVTLDSADNVYVSDAFNHTIRKITPDGTVSTFAGQAGMYGSQDGAASSALFKYPSDLVFDNQGNLYVAEEGNPTIRKIAPDGTVSTLAGSATSSGTVDGTGSAARFSLLAGIALDNQGNLIVADSIGHTIRKVTPAGVVTTIAGIPLQNGTADGQALQAQFDHPGGVAVDAAGTVFVGDYYNHAIRMITAAGTVSTLAGLAGTSGSADGVGSSARFNYPFGIALDASGNLFVSDDSNDTIRMVTPGGQVTTVGGTPGLVGSADGVGSEARFHLPQDVAVGRDGKIYVADRYNHIIRVGQPSSPPPPTAFTITATAGAGGTITPNGSLSKSPGGSQIFTATPNANFAVDRWLVDGNAAQTNGTTFALFNIQADHAVMVTFRLAQSQYTVVASAGAGGSITPNGNLTPAAGVSLSFTATPSAGFAIDHWILDGTSAQQGGVTFLLNNIQADHAVQVTFRLQKKAGFDFNGDGDPDLVFQNTDGSVGAWFMNGSENLLSGSFFTPYNVGDLGWHIVGTGDFDGDGNPDLLFQHSDGTLATWFMSGTSLASAAYLNPANAGLAWSVAGTGDFNNDGHVDILLQNTDGSLAIWFMSGVNLLRGQLVNPNNPGTGWRVAGTGDFDQDGNTDILFEHLDGTLAVWFMSGSNFQSSAYLTPVRANGIGWHIRAIVDLDKDGKPDLIFQHDDGTLAVWFMNGITLRAAHLLNPANPGSGWQVVGPK